MTKIIISPSAHQDLLGILDFIAMESEQTALKFVGELQERMRKVLETFPSSGSPLDEKTRYLVIRGRTFIYEYRETLDEVHILHIISPGQDWQ